MTSPPATGPGDDDSSRGDGDVRSPRLLLGPLLRHVGPTSATVWVEVSAPCTVRVLGADERTFTVAGHHYALVVVRDLEPGAVTAYQVELDGDRVWPLPDSRYPPSVVRTPTPDAPVQVSFGSCRYACPLALTGRDTYGPDALDALARRLAVLDPRRRPDLLLLLGDQVYADETTEQTRARIARRRGEQSEPHGEVADFEEYTWLYRESWSDPEVRWLLSTVPTGMIFDDHDVHDDWNTSGSWRRDAAGTSWWAERIVGALQSYWVYQHLGNLSPDELDAEPTWRKIRALGPGEDAEPLLRALALAADREADGAKGYRWSFRRDVGRTRVVVLDSRCGRILDTDQRSMLSEAEFAWFAEQLHGDYDHLLVGTSLPWLMAPALHDLEAWDERLATTGSRRASLGERLRRAGDLEHWASFRLSFDRLCDLLGALAAGRAGRPAPATVCVLSGDVHHSYLARATWPDDDGSGDASGRRDSPGPGTAAGDRGGHAPVYQVTCSPLHNSVPTPMRLAFRLSWSRAAERAARFLLGRLADIPRPPIRWHRVAGGPWFGNAVATLSLDGRRARLMIESSEQPLGAPPLRLLAAVDLTPPDA
jgi:hypothetical protein